MPRAPESVSVAFRLPAETVELLDDQARSMGVSRSMLLRAIVQTSLGDDVRLQALREVSYRLKPLLLRAVAYGASQVQDKLPELIAQELAELG